MSEPAESQRRRGFGRFPELPATGQTEKENIMPLPIHEDGCIVPNIPTRNYIVYMAPKCEHKKVRGAYVAIRAENADAALEYAGTWIRMSGLCVQSVTDMTDEAAIVIPGGIG
jgi:hypothetical protein